MKRTTSTRLRTKAARAKRLRRKRRIEQRVNTWARGLTLTTGASGLIGAVGAPLLRLLAEQSGLRSGLSTVLGRLRPDFVPEHDRGQVLVDVAVALGLGAVSVAGTRNLLSASQAVLGQVASAPTTWRALTELDATALAAVAKARATHRRAIWARLAARPGGFPWLRVAEQTWTGWIVLDVDASLVESHSDKEGAAGTYKKHVFGLHPIVVSCANTGEILAVLLRPGNSGSNTAADHVAVLSEAVAQLPAPYRKKIIFRADGVWPGVEDADVSGVESADVRGGEKPRGGGPGGAFVGMVPWLVGMVPGQSSTSVTAARAATSSTSDLLVANVATRACRARLLMARG